MKKSTSYVIAGATGAVVLALVAFLLGRSSSAREEGSSDAQSRAAVATDAVVDVTVGSASHIWGRGPGGSVFQLQDGKWKRRIGIAAQLAAGADGTLWSLNDTGAPYHWNGQRWEKKPGSFLQIDVGNKDLVYTIDGKSRARRWDRGKWSRMSGGRLLRISVAADGTVWGLNRARVPVRLEKEKWKKVGKKTLLAIDVGSATDVWGIDDQGRLVRFIDGAFSVVADSPKAVDVSVAQDGTVWSVWAQPQQVP